MRLASRFGSNAHTIRTDAPLTDDQIREVAPSIFAETAHESRSERYTYIPTADVLAGLRKEGFQPFMACQTKVRNSDKREHTKHMLRLRHASQINGKEANEIILLNSHDGSSSYQMMSGVYRFVCSNGMVCGETLNDIRVPHKGDVVGRVIEGAFSVLESFEKADEQRDAMQLLTLNPGEQQAFARAALTLRYDDPLIPAPITEDQILRARRRDDLKDDLWTTFNRVQENIIKGDLRGRTATGKAMRTRPVTGIDQNVKLNRALWVLSEEMRKLKG
ncbi:DUF945 domain-containing protein [Chromobacterium haemolyticum]|uniref:DUF945 domain-containing protein n=1 Tax=Chromobacterium fluminis TaxID=3044269 RepID=A0ABX0LHT7_9NEIS|nr:DUF932 domain-containing protein [Chromobacterium haemolyticum]NHR08758.1 DUF945 domain-containing protein [Chromobacterium haemolyticum]